MLQLFNNHIRGLSNSAPIVAREYHYAGLPCMILNGSDTRSQNIIDFRRNGMYESLIPHIVIHPRHLKLLVDLIDQRMHNDFLEHRPFTLNPLTDAGVFDTNAYILDWVYRLEYQGYAAILPERSTHFHLKTPSKGNVFPGAIHDFIKRKGGLGLITAAIAGAVDQQRAQVVRRMPYANSVLSPFGVIRTDVEALISKPKNL